VPLPPPSQGTKAQSYVEHLQPQLAGMACHMAVKDKHKSQCGRAQTGHGGTGRTSVVLSRTTSWKSPRFFVQHRSNIGADLA